MPLEELPNRSRGEVAFGLARAALSAVPVVGGPVAELLGLVLAPAFERRQRAWLEGLASGLEELKESRGVRLDELRENDAFIDVVFHASRSAVATAQAEKIEALRNAVLNAACGIDLGETTRHMFIQWVDELTPAHLRLLRILDGPDSALGERARHYRERSLGGSLMEVIRETMPDLARDGMLLIQLGNELHLKGLIKSNNLETVRTSAGLLASQTTPLGREFLTFILPPSRSEAASG